MRAGDLRDGETRGVRDLVVRADDERFETVARIEPERVARLFGVPAGIRGANSLPEISATTSSSFVVDPSGSGRKFHVPRGAKSGHDRGLQCGHVITLDPKLIDVVWNAKGERLIGRLDQLHRGKPTLESVRTDLRLEGCRQFLP